MGDAAQKQASHCDLDHGLGYVEPSLVVANKPAPARQPPPLRVM
jgi:hypothetical protein